MNTFGKTKIYVQFLAEIPTQNPNSLKALGSSTQCQKEGIDQKLYVHHYSSLSK
ncbi:hypothetical protein JCM16307_09280 [Thermococcus prieurii]